ncbi:hypothetical protein ABE073_04510 [Lederbergia citrisecunda]|uniref:hypothetical protein n=1 Tax=Lederbergia citrisecunda TaxID=2833583 RepID=UPI003D2D9F3A
MLKKFMDWWGRQPYVESREAIDLEDNHLQTTNDYRFETTLARDLNTIADLMGREFPKNIARNSWKQDSKRIEFRSEDYSVKEIKKAINLDSFKIENDYSNIGTVYWSLEISEYEKVYKSKHSYYANVVRKLLKIVKDNIDKPDYFYVFCKYEDSIHIVATTLKDDYNNNNGEINEEVFQKAKTIIEKCGETIVKRYKELEHIEELQKEAVSKSLINRLDNEIDFIDKYIEVQ